MADKKFTIEFDVNANLGNIKSAAEQLQTIFNKLPANLKQGTDLTFKKLLGDLEELQRISANGVISGDKLKTAQRLFDRITASVDRLNIQTSKVKGIKAEKLLPPDILNQFKSIEAAFRNLENKKSEAFKTDEIKKYTKDLREAEEAQERYNKAVQAEKSLKGQLGAATRSKNTADTKLAQAQNRGASTEELTRLQKAATEADQKVNQLREDYQKAQNTLTNVRKNTNLTTLAQTIKDCEQKLKQLNAEAEKSALDDIARKIEQFQGLQTGTLNIQNFEQLRGILETLPEQKVKELGIDLDKAGREAEQCAEEIKPIDDELVKASSAAESFTEREREMAQVANQVKQFFSIGNTIQLFKRAIRSAFDTIKELDEVMTQTAVVTDFTVGDMWNQLPEYTRRANELGVSVKGAYEAATLYYQQGLKTNQVIGVSNETLKMAKIAGIEYATATDYMTSALRGFNMEVNEDSARKVNDIYSELAAVTAADTAELSIAMSKTASLASNAGMQIETTTALLAKMIETTREAPETLGTAMKTVIARFQELKKDPALIEPVDGEIVDANKIEAALRTIDVALRDSSGQFRDLDGVFLDIAEKWDSLDTNTQRYIATIAAGSRQQSRFIAMMTDYPRTMELVDAANTSAGASQRQFEKTLDSMASALDRLKNAWNEFVMGLANNQIVKGVIDAIRMFIKAVADLTDMLSFGSGFLKSFWNLGALIGGIKLARGVFTGFFGWLTKSGKEAGQGVGAALHKGISNGVDKAKTLLSRTTWVDNKAVINQLKEIEDYAKKNPYSQVKPNNPAMDYKNLATTLKFNNQQQAIYNQLTDVGISENTSARIVLAQLNEEERKAILLKIEKAKAEGLDIAATEEEIIAQYQLQNTERLGLVTKTKYIGLTIFGTETKKKEAFAHLVNTKAIQEETLAYKILDAVSKASILTILAYVAAIAAVVAIVVALVNLTKKTSLSYKLEQAKEATDNAKKSAEEAKAAYDDLLESKTGFDELQQSLKDLTYGTLEWRQALLEANQQVIDLIDKYPQLVNYLEEGEYGQLTISSEGWDTLLERQLANVRNTQGAQVIAQARENRLLNTSAYSEYRNTDIAGISGRAQRELLNNIKDFDPAKITMEEFAESIGVTTDQAMQAYTALQNYNNAVKENELATESAAASYIKMTATEAGLEGTAADYLASGLNSLLTSGNFEGAIKKNDITDTDTFNELVDTYGIRSQLTGDLTDNLERLYAAMTNQAEEDVEDLFEGDRNKLKQAIADVANADKFNQFTAETIKAYQTASEDQRKALDMAMSEGTAFINKSELLGEDQLEAIYEANEDLFGLVYETSDDYVKAYLDAAKNGEKDLEEAKAKLNEYGIWDSLLGDFGKNLSSGAISGLSDKLVEVFEVSGKDAAQNLGIELNKIFEEMEPEEAEKFAATLNKIDWSNKKEVENFSRELKSLGVTSKLTDDEIDALEEQIIELAKASDKVDLSTLIDQIKSLTNYASRIQSGDFDITSISEEDKKNLIDQVGDLNILSDSDFFYNAFTGAYQFKGSIEDLSNALTAASDKAVASSKAAYESASAAKEIQEAWDESGKKVNKKDADSMIQYLEDYVAAGGRLAQDEIDRISGDLDALQEKVKEVQAEAASYDATKAQYEEVKPAEYINAQLNNSVYDNAQNVSNAAYNGRWEDVEGYSNALMAQATAAGVATEKINALRDAVLANDQLAIERTAIELAEATRLTELNTQLEVLKNSYEDWGYLVDNLDTKGSWTREQVQAWQDMTVAANKMFDVSSNISKYFWDDAKNANLLRDAINGSEEAMIALNNEIAKEELKVNMGIELDETEYNEVSQAIDDLTNEDIEIGATLDTTSFGEGLVDLLVASGATVDDINAAFEQIGWNPEFDYEEMTLDQAQDYGLSAEQQIIVPDGKDKNGVPKYRVDTLKTFNDGGAAGDTIIRVPVIKGKSNGTIGNGGATATSLSKAMGAKTTFNGSNSHKGLSAPKPSSGSGGGGSDGGSDETEEWKNPYDWLYNLTKKINAELRIRERLERNYQRLLKRHAATGRELKDIHDKEVASLEKRQHLQEEMLRLRKQEAETYLNKNLDMAQYATIDWELEEVQINWDLIDKIKDTELGEKVEEYISKIEEIIGKIQDAEDAIEDIEDELIEIKERGRDQYLDLESRVLSALIKERQEQIDEQDRIYKAITDAASDLTDSIQKNIDKIRQDRQNEETETSLAEKERRLAYLRQDTTGSNALDIKKLEKELADEKQNYTDSLIDQSLNDLKEQNDIAAKQRDKQIELMQSELDWREKTGYYVDEATKILRDGLGSDGVLDKSSRLAQILWNQENGEALGAENQRKWWEELKDTIAQAYEWKETNRKYENADEVITAMKQNSLKWLTATPEEQKEITKNQAGLAENYRALTGEDIYSKNGAWYHENGERLYELDATTAAKAVVAKMKANSIAWETADESTKAKLAEENENLAARLASFLNKKITKSQGVWYIDGEELYKKYKRGGLVDFTGPAWLDGTKSKPEMVLNAKDTENLIQLKNILAGLNSGIVGKSDAQGGDWYFDIDVNVGEIANDYDVDRVAERVKQSIYTEATYRNVNAIKFLK